MAHRWLALTALPRWTCSWTARRHASATQARWKKATSSAAAVITGVALLVSGIVQSSGRLLASVFMLFAAEGIWQL